jgi:hypothetical protein
MIARRGEDNGLGLGTQRWALERSFTWWGSNMVHAPMP